jgi:hypothetical protein
MATKQPASKELRSEDFPTAKAYETARELAYLKELVPLKLHKSKEESDDVPVQINGFTRLLQRGVTIMVPREVAIQIEQSDDQLNRAMRLVEEAEKSLTGI